MTIETARSRRDPPTWSSWREAVGVVFYWPHLKRTMTIALVVGSVLFCINQLNVVLSGRTTVAVVVKSMVTYLVPFSTANAGVLVATRAGAGRP